MQVCEKEGGQQLSCRGDAVSVPGVPETGGGTLQLVRMGCPQ